MSAYRNAIDFTTATINKRAKLYRNLIIAVSFAGIAFIAFAVISWSLIPLVGIIFLVPCCGMYLWLDGNLLNQWRYKLLKDWNIGEIDFRALRDAIAGISILPKNTVESMMAMLPYAGDLVAEQGIHPSTRNAIALLINMIHTCRTDQLFFKTVGYTVVGSLILVSAVFWVWQPLLGVVIIIPMQIFIKWIRAHRINATTGRLVAAKQQSDVDLDQLNEIIFEMDCAPISDADMKSLIG